jgi:hypothetical protein
MHLTVKAGVFLLGGVLLLLSCNENKKGVDANQLVSNPLSVEKPSGLPKIVFSDTLFDFGKLVTGQTTEKVFNFKNQGDAPLIVQNVTSSCGCTAPVWNGDPIAPQGTGSVTVKFDSEGKLGIQERVVTVITNGNPSRAYLKIKGTVVPFGS